MVSWCYGVNGTSDKETVSDLFLTFAYFYAFLYMKGFGSSFV